MTKTKKTNNFSNIKVGDIFYLDDSYQTKFKTTEVDANYFYEITAISLDENDDWEIGEEDQWTFSGYYEAENKLSTFGNIEKIFNREKYPEYYL